MESLHYMIPSAKAYDGSIPYFSRRQLVSLIFLVVSIKIEGNTSQKNSCCFLKEYADDERRLDYYMSQAIIL